MDASIARPRITKSHSRLAIISLAAMLFVALLFGVLLTSGAQAYSYTNEEATFVSLLNEYRVANGLSPLLVSDLISEACYRHNHDMAKYKFFSHYSETSDWFATDAPPWDRMSLSGYDFYTSKGENIAAGQQTAAEVFEAWKASSGHNANMLNSAYTVIGISLYQLAGSPYTFYWTTDFGGYTDSTAHEVSPAPLPSTTRFEQDNSKLAYTGSWSHSVTNYDSEGGYTYVNGTASVTCTFSGTYLSYVTKKGPSYGYVKITLDGGTPVSVDLYNGSTLYQQSVWNTGVLANRNHTVKLEWAGVRRSAATACNIGLDAFDIAGTLDGTPGAPNTSRYQQTDTHISYAGNWSTYSTAAASGRSYTRASAGTASCTVNFNGTYLAWIATAGTTLGKAYVSLDGGAAQLIDLHRTAVAYQQSVWNTGTLSDGQHTVKIWWHSANTVGQYISVDAFDVKGTLVTAAPVAVGGESTRYEQTDGHIVYAGSWSTFSRDAASGGSYTRASAGTASCTVNFNGTYLAWIATAGTTLGKAYVSLDGGAAQLIDLHRTAVAYQQSVWNTGTLSDGQHTVKIWWHSANTVGQYISVDAFDVKGTLVTAAPVAVGGESTRYEQTDGHIVYAGSWSTFSRDAASGGSYTRASAGTASCTVNFNGTYLAWIATAGTTLGKAYVSLDGGAAQLIDLHRTAVAYQQSVWNTGTLSDGQHTVKIWWHSANTVGQYISVDAFVVEGALN